MNPIAPEKIFGSAFLHSNHPEAVLPDAPVFTDSRMVTPGAIFAAIPGTRVDGADFIPEALDRGAAAILYTGDFAVPEDSPILFCRVSDPREAVSRLCRYQAGEPDAALRVYGVTGTNGKTTSAYLLRHLLHAADVPCGLVSTVEYDDGCRRMPPTHTTPDPRTLFPLLAAMRDNGLRAAAMEFSSHALAQKRLSGILLRGGIFTNLTGDHLDFHGDMEHYYQAKKTLFTELIAPGGVAAVNLDDPAGARLAEELTVERPDLKIPTFGTRPGAGWRISEMESDADGCRFVLSNAQQAYHTEFPLPGEYNIHNLAGVLTLLLCDGVAPEALDAALALPLTVPGRLEKITAPGGACFFVDYAHTDDALTNVLRTLRPLCRNRLIAVFGAGGDRDKSKRPRMGKAAARWADKLIITSDNPRSEDPLEIIVQIVSGLPEACDYEVIADRESALRRAAEIAGPGDVVLVAGKGHETYQEIHGVRHHFDDREILRTILEASR
ncbi:MAG: UDP-N-acetylmuramoyl-L-alanyl-D-glutamate--2,6-diaminopimelate ligase [Lentisphaeria bacterium]|nr:UDP-N-acetylmuramoyl-L-alanyl-D-glutamate--2,6-diaminopimelate ligase [Lentisphaeria bacterium]